MKKIWIILGVIAWILICRPLLILFLWIMGLQFLYEHMVVLGGFQDLIEFWKIYIYVILFIFIVIKGWNFYNRFRFRTKSRRSQVRPADNDEIDKFFKLSGQGSETIQRWNDIAIDFKDNYELRIYDATQKDQKSSLGHFKPM